MDNIISTSFDDPGETDYENRLVSNEYIESDFDADNPLRPKAFGDYIGQDAVKENLKIYIDAAKARGDVLDHCLLYGPPGLGKTTLAGIIAHEMGVGMRITSGPAIERASDLAAILTSLNFGDVLFIDECHRINRQAEEILYPAMEDFAIDIVTGKGQGAMSYHLPLKRFTLIGATTRAGQLSAPMRDRYNIQLRLELYTPEQLARIVRRSAAILDVPIEPDGALELASRARGTPRIANRLLRRTRDFAIVLGNGVITEKIAREALDRLEIDELGLDKIDRRLLESMIKFYDGGPVGLDTIAAAIGEEAVTIEDMCEPYLMQIGFIKRTPRGRCVTRSGYIHLGYKPPENAAEAQTTLF